MTHERARVIDAMRGIVQQFGLESLTPALRACEALAGEDALLDVAVLGQFKSGKSSLLNALLGATIFPVSALPATAVVTRAAAGPSLVVRVRYLDGSTADIDPARIGEFVTEAGNPRNRRKVGVVDVFTPAMRDWPGVRLVDTPGLGSVYAHNTEATRAWMPNVAVALVTVSAERPLSDEDRRLVAEARDTAARVVVVLTKVDLLTPAEREEMTAFLDRALREGLGIPVPLLPFSTREEPGRWLARFQESVLTPVSRNVAGEREAALGHKLNALARSCREYLEVGLQAAERADADRGRLRAAVLDESVNAGVIRDELRTAERRMREGTRPAFEGLLLPRRAEVAGRLVSALSDELPTWRGGLARQTQRFEAWMRENLDAELTPLSQEAATLANALLEQAEERLRRVVEAFRDRLGRNLREATGLTISPVRWEAWRPKVAAVPVAVGRTFMTNWDLLSWLLPMWLVGGLFRSHVVGRVPWEAEKNLSRLVADWTTVADAATSDLCRQAESWVESELATLSRLLDQRPAGAEAFRKAIGRLDEFPPRPSRV